MTYLLLVYVTPESLRGLSEEDKHSLHGQHEAEASTNLIAHYRLRPPRLATTVSIDGDQIVKTEGPSAEPSERLRAFYVLESDEQDAVLDFASQIPAVRLGGTAEARPLIEPGQHAPERHGTAGR